MIKRDTRHFLSFVIGALLVIALLLALTANNSYRYWSYHYFEGDYIKLSWVYDTAIARSRHADNIFMGSSHVYNGVDDRRISQALKAPDAAYNAAVPTEGRDLEFVVLRDMLQASTAKRLFIEVRETEERTSHFGFPILANVNDVLTAPPNPWWPRNLLFSLQSRFEYIVSRVPVLRRQDIWQGAAPVYGYVVNPHQWSRARLVSREAQMRVQKRWRILPEAFGDLEFSMSEAYLRKVAALCRERNIELHFLYLPFLGAPAQPAQANFYGSLGTLHLLPDFIRNDPQYWADNTHFNALGTKVYTDWLIKTALYRRP